MFDIGFWELLVIATVLMLVMGPERLPEVARQAAFYLRKARQGMYKLRSEMKSELGGTDMAGLDGARQEMANFKNDIQQFGRDLANSHEDVDEAVDKESTTKSKPAKKVSKKKAGTKKVSKKVAKKVAKKKTSKKVSKKVSKKKAKTVKDARQDG